MSDYIYLEHDGKLLLVNSDGEGPVTPIQGRINWEGSPNSIRLPTPQEVTDMGILWDEKRSNNIVLGDIEKKIIIATPKIK